MTFGYFVCISISIFGIIIIGTVMTFIFTTLIKSYKGLAKEFIKEEAHELTEQEKAEIE